MTGNHQLSRTELEAHLLGQLRALERATQAFDDGDLYVGADMARIVANLLLDRGRNTRSLLGRLRYLPMPFADASSGQYDLDTAGYFSLMSTGLATLVNSTDKGAFYEPGYLGYVDFPFRDIPHWGLRAFDIWWESQIVFHSDGIWSRRSMVETIRDKMGGSHIDDIVPAAMQRIASGVGATFVQGEGEPIPNLHWACMRHIAEEVLVTVGIRTIV